MSRKESRQFNISVEGINCEKMYFEHLAKLINSSDRSTYNLKVDYIGAQTPSITTKLFRRG